ncbi:MAG: hypothetical protein KGN34_10585 [Sphingomonadales bacterium]|nr:hypothetical protein [Sphingomonadales bacterium]
MTPLALLLAAAPAPATLADFEATLAAQPSATRALTEWCGMRGLAGTAPPRIEATTLADAVPLPRSGHRLLQTRETAFRHVHLACNGTVLSEAFNWYVPARLTPEMNTTLATTRTPFGTVVAPLHFTRTALATRPGRARPCPAGTISSHRAVLRLPDGQPLAYLVECYTAANLAP